MSTFCDMDPPVFYCWTEPVARKQHVCDECLAPILKGEKHFAYRGKWDGGIGAGRQHLACMEACMLIRDEFTDGDCLPFGGLKDEWLERERDWLRETDRSNPSWKKLRSLMAKILWRERPFRRKKQ